MSDGLISLSLDGHKAHTRDPFQFKEILDLTVAGPVLTLTLIAINLILFLLMEWKGGSTDSAILIFFGAAFGPLVKQGQYWRLLTSAFLHDGIVHLLFNMWALLILGGRLEPIVGTVRFGVIYFVSALSGSLLGLWAFPQSICVGASGAIFGIAGAMLVIGTTHPNLVPGGVGHAFGPGVLPFLFYNLVYAGYYNLTHASNTTQINLMAHMGGLLGGVVCVLVLKPHAERLSAKWLAVAVAAALVLSAFIFPLVSTEVMGLTLAQLKQERRVQPVLTLLRTGKTAQAQAALDKLGDTAQNNRDFHVFLGILLDSQGNRAGAEHEYHEAIEVAPNYAGGHQALGAALLRWGRPDEAIAESKAAVRLDSTASNSHFLLARALLMERATDDAVRELRISAQLNPKWSEPHRLLSIVLTAQGKGPEGASERALADRLAKTSKTTGQ
jgi:rhomboid protease GluP